MSSIINHSVPADDGNSPLPEPEVTPYFRRCAEVLKAVEAEAAIRGLPSADGDR